MNQLLAMSLLNSILIFMLLLDAKLLSMNIVVGLMLIITRPTIEPPPTPEKQKQEAQDNQSFFSKYVSLLSSAYYLHL